MKNGPFLGGEAHYSGQTPTRPAKPRATDLREDDLDNEEGTGHQCGYLLKGRKEKGETGWGVSPPPSPPWHQPHEVPRTARKVASYRNHPPVPEPQHRVAQEQSREAEEGQDLGARDGGEPSQARRRHLPLLRADLPLQSCSPRFPPRGCACCRRKRRGQCFFQDNSDVFLDRGLVLTSDWGLSEGGVSFRKRFED